MDSADQRLAHSLKMKFGTSPHEPTVNQLHSIKQHIEAIHATGRMPTESDWARAVGMYCPSAGTHKYAGIDNSDLNTLLEMAKKSREVVMKRDLTKSEIERIFGIVEWEPTSRQLAEISLAIRRCLTSGNRLSIADGREIVADIYPDASFIAIEGVDNSDLNTLLALASKVK